MQALLALLALVKVHIRLYLADRRALMINLAMPILIAAFFGAVLGGGSSKISQIEIGAVDLDHSELSAAVLKGLAEESALKLIPLSEEQAQDRVKRGKLRVAFVLPLGFGEQAGSALMGVGVKPEVKLFYDPSESTSLAMLRGLLAQAAMQQSMRLSFSGQGGQRRLDEALKGLEARDDMSADTRATLGQLFKNVRELQAQASAAAASAPAEAAEAAEATNSASAGGQGGMSLPYTLAEQAITSRPDQQYNGYAHSFAGMGVQFVLFMGIDLGVGILLARRAGLWQRLRAAPLSRLSLLGSYFVSTSLIAASVLAIVMVVGTQVFGSGVSGSWLGLALIVACYGCFTAGFGLFLAAVGRSPEATRGLSILATLLMVMLSGAWIPSFVFPPWLQSATLIVPVRWAVDGLDAMSWRGLDFAAALAPSAVLLGSALLLVALAWWRFDWRE
jgi:ABC-2 type transport system permease protein